MNKFQLIRRSLRNTRGERGVALLYALGILSIVLVTVMIFTSITKTESKVAGSYCNSAITSSIAQSALNRAFLHLKTYSEAGANISALYTTSVTDEKSASDSDWLWKIVSYDSADRLWRFPDGSALNRYPALKRDLRWNYIYNSSDNSRLVGRYAYVILGSDRLPLNAYADHSDCQDKSGDPVACTATSSCAYHYGRSMAELQFKDLCFDDATVFLTPAILKTKKSPNGSSLYIDTDDLISDLAIIPTRIKAAQEQINTKFNIASLSVPETFSYEDSEKKEISYHRFNLNRSNWNSLGLADILKSAVTYNPASPDDPGTGGIPLLNNMTDEAQKKQIAANLLSYNSPWDRATITDVTGEWTDANTPTYIGLKRTPYLNELEFQCYAYATLEEDSVVRDGEGNITNYVCHVAYHLRFYAQSELVQMYETILGGIGDYKLKLFGKVDVSFQNNAGQSGDAVWTNFIANENDRDLKNLTNWVRETADNKMYSSYTLKTSGNVAYFEFSGNGAQFTTANATKPDVGTIANVRVNELCLKGLRLDRSSEQTDYVILASEFAEGGVPTYAACQAGDYSVDTGKRYLLAIDWQADDPRDNLKKTATCVSNITNTGALPVGTIGSLNSGLTIAADGNDKEIVTDPAWLGPEKNQHVSTAFIRHAPMQSPWELGAIHRGEAWKTINLKKAQEKAYTVDLNTVGLGTYAEGDGLLLEVVKLTGKSNVSGKINMNSSGTNTAFGFESLFREMQFDVNGHYDPTATFGVNGKTGGLTVASEARRLITFGETPTKALRSYLETAKIPIKRRTDIYQSDAGAEFWNLVNGNTSLEISAGYTLALNTDALQEQLIGRTINLMKADAGHDAAFIVIIAQSIQELPADAKIFKFWNENETLAASNDTDGAVNAGYLPYNRKQTGLFTKHEPFEITAQIGTYENGADQITGEVKMLAEAVYDAGSGKWKIVRIQYAE